jgi:hypothetical protein
MGKAKGIGLMILFALILVGGLGCSLTMMTKQAPGMHVSGLSLAELSRDQYVILDSVEGTGEVKCWFKNFACKPKDVQLGHIGSYAGGGEMESAAGGAAAGVKALVGAAGLGGAAMMASGDKAYKMALYSALVKAPDADFVLPTSSTVSVKGTFLHTTHTATVRGKSVRLKSDRELGRR